MVTLACLVLAFPFFLQGEELRKFTDNQGRTIEASVVGVDSAMVEIRMANGRLFRVPREKFSEKDQEYFDKWESLQALKNERTFEISARRRDENESESRGSGIIRKNRDGFYEITVENRTGSDIEGLELRYLIRIERTGAGQMNDRRQDAWESGKIEDFSIFDRQEKSEETKRIGLVETDLMPGWRWVTAAPPKSEDKLKGIYVAVMLDGSLIREYSMPSGFLEEGRSEMFRDKKKE